MANAAAPISHSRNLYDLPRQIVPPQVKAAEIYRRLLAINELSGLMNAARDVNSVMPFLAAYFQEHLPEASVRLYILDGTKYRKVQLSGSAPDKTTLPRNDEIAASVMKSKIPLWVPGAKSSRKIHKFSGATMGLSAQSILAFPFSAKMGVVGCLELVSNQPSRFDEMDYHLGLLIASHLSSALENILTRQELAAAKARLRDHDLRLTELNEKCQQLAHTDEATGLLNKRRLFELLDMKVARARRYGEVLSCLMIDVDDFKQINDTHGHPVGDQVLRQIGDLLQRSLRVTDFKARYGGEEFTVLLHKTDRAGAFRASENLRAAFMSHDFSVHSAVIRLTVSIGVACCSKFDDLNSQQVIRLADSALYRAKKSGKNRVCFADENETLESESQEFVMAGLQV